MKFNPDQTLIWDIETNGLLHQLDKVHVLTIRDFETRQTWVFRHNKREHSIPDGIAMLNKAGVLVGHNIIGFDMEALWKVYGDLFAPEGIVRDTLVMARMLFADEKERDFKRWKRGLLEGKYIGSHELGAWGQRLGFPKDGYAPRRKEKAIERWKEDEAIFDEIVAESDPDLLEAVKEERKEELGYNWLIATEIVAQEDPKNALVRFENQKAFIHHLTWGFWNQDMEDYGVQDLDPTEALWLKITKKSWSDTAIRLEHKVHALMERVTQNGFPFDMQKAEALDEELRVGQVELEREAIAHFGKWWKPTKWKTTGEQTTYVNPETGQEQKDQRPFFPREGYGEDTSRLTWGEVSVPKRDINYKKPQKDGNPHANKTAGAAFCPVELVEFNPGSRPQIINRLTKIYEWEPQEFTEAGSPRVNDEILRDLASEIPICVTLAELFYFNKRLGQLVDGKNGWMKKAVELGDGIIHPRFNVGGTVTNRCTHSNPNIAQVPRVVYKSPTWLNADGTPLLGPDDAPIKGRPVFDDAGEFVLDENGKVKTKKVLMKGRAGDHGWECRDLFTTLPGFVIMGADQAGIELRCLAHYMASFDGGEYGRKLLEEDIHTVHQMALGLDSRDMAKTFIYAMIYGAADYKLGATIDPKLILKPKQAKALGKQTRDNIMTRLPALGALIKATQREAKRGFITALDGRHLYVRGMHSALNTKLQGAGATLAKAWCVIFEELMEEAGLVHGWQGDFAIMGWIHDEIQTAVRDDDRTKLIAERCINEAAEESGLAFDFALPVDIDVKWGRTWAETH